MKSSELKTEVSFYVETESSLVVARRWGFGDGERLLRGCEGPFWVMKYLELEEVVIAQRCERTKCHRIVPFQMVNE